MTQHYEEQKLGRPCPTCHGYGFVVDDPIPSAPARPTDPDTSHVAGPRSTDVRRFSVRSRQAKLLEVIYQLPRTAQSAALLTVGRHAPLSALEGCRRRVSDLVAAGYVRDSGRRKQNDGSPDESIVWEITLSGLEALGRLHRDGWSR